MKEEIEKGVKLKKIELEEKKPKITKNECNLLQNVLAKAIDQRKHDLTKNDVESGSDSDWSD